MAVELAVEEAGRAALGSDVAVADLAINYLRLVRKGPARTNVRVLRLGHGLGPGDGDDEALLRVELRDAGAEVKTWLSGPVISNDERHFSSPLHASRKFSKWLDGLSGTSGNWDAISRARSSGMMWRGALWVAPLKVRSLL